MWQMQDGSPWLNGYNSKTLPTACLNYSVTELEMFGLHQNIMMWAFWLGINEFDCAVDHQAIVQIIKSKNEPKSNRIKLLLEHLSHWRFNLYYVKGKDMILCDFLSRIKVDNTDPTELMPISFRHVREIQDTSLNVLTRARLAAEGKQLPPVHGIEKALDPHKKPEHQPEILPTPIPRPTYRPPPKTSAQLAKKKLLKKAIQTLTKPK